MIAPLVKYGANFKIVGKANPDQLSHPGAFVPVETSIPELADHIAVGYPWMFSILDDGTERRQQNANYAELLAVDVDNSAIVRDGDGKPIKGEDGKSIKCYTAELTIEQAIAHPFISQYAALGIESASSQENWHKMRLVFRLTNPVHGWQTIRAVVTYLITLLGVADPACKDAHRFFFGAPGRSPFLLNESVTLPESFVDEALAWHKEQERKAEESYRAAMARREQFKTDDQDTFELVKQALEYIPRRDLGSGNYSECLSVLMALYHEFGEADAIALGEWWSPSIDGSTWDVERKIRSFRRGSSRPVTVGTLFHIAKQYGFRFPEGPKAVEWGAPKPAEYAQVVARQQEQDRVEQAVEKERSLKTILSRLKRRFSSRREKLRQQQQVIAQSLNSGDVFEYNEGDRLSTWGEAVSRGHRYILDQSPTGTSKTYESGLARPEDFGASRFWYMTNEQRNPTVPTLGDWDPLESRHAGQTRDSRGKLRHAKPGDEVEIQANCRMVDAITIVREKNVQGADTDAVCRSCLMQKMCKIGAGNGYGFKSQRRETLAHSTRIRAHQASLPGSGEFDYSNDGFLWDDVSVTTHKTIHVDLDDLNAVIAAIATQDPEFFALLSPFLFALQKLMNEKHERHGLGLDVIRDKLPTVRDDLLDWERLSDLLQPDLSALKPADELDTSELNQQLEQEIAAIKAQYKRDLDDLNRQYSYSLGLIEAGQQCTIALQAEGIQLEDEKTQLAALQDNFKQQQQRLEANRDQQIRTVKENYRTQIKEIDRVLRRTTSQTTQETINLLKSTVLKQWLPEFLDILGGGRGFAHVSQGHLTLTLPDGRATSVIHSARFNVFLDATKTREDLALELGIAPSEIFVCRQRVNKVDNLKIIQATDLGRMGMHRGEEQKRRAAAIIKHYREIDPTTQEIDFKKFTDKGQGAWWRDTRGSNDFQTCKTLVLVGTPCRNINALLAEYAVLTGVCDPDDEGFKAYVKRQTLADIHQAIGRLRAHRRKGEQLTIVLLSDFLLDIEVEQVKASSITPEAADKVERFKTAALAAAKQLIEKGKKLTQTAVAAIAGYSQQYVSRHWKLLLLLLEDSNSKSSKNSAAPPPAELVELVEATATGTTPQEFIQSLEKDLYEWICLSQWRDIWHHLSSNAQNRILEALFMTLPTESLSSLLEPDL